MAASTRWVLVLVAVVLVAVVGGIAFLGGLGPRPPEDGPGEGPASRSGRSARGLGGHEGPASLLGIVLVAPDREPAASRKVLLTPEDESPLRVETDGRGRFRFDDLEPGRAHELRLEEDGFAAVRIPGIVLDPGEERDVGELVLAPAATAPVRVLDHVGSPVADAAVGAYVVPDWRGVDWSRRFTQLAAAPVAVAEVRTDAEGRARFDGLAPGRWTFLAKKKGFARTGRTYVNLRAGAVAEESVIRLRPGFPLGGRVLDEEDRTLPGVVVMAIEPGRVYSLQHAPLHERARSSEDGEYTFEALPAGDHVLYVAVGNAPAVVVAAVRIPAVDRLDLRVVRGGVLRGTVRGEEDGEPVAGAKVSAWSRSARGTAYAVTFADEEGRYAFEPLPGPVMNSLYAEAEGWITTFRSTQIWVAHGEEATHDLVLVRGARLSGTVTGPDGPVADAQVRVWYTRREGYAAAATCRTDAEGRYETDSVRAGPVLVQVTKSGLLQSDAPRDWQQAFTSGQVPERYRATVPEKGEATLDIALSRGGILEGKVVDEEGQPLAATRVSVQRSAIWTESDADGAFRLVGVPTETTVAVVGYKTGYVTTEPTSVEVPSADVVGDVVVRLRAAPVVTGKVGTEDGRPVPGARITVYAGSYRPRPFRPEQRPREASATAAADGSFEATIPMVRGQFVLVAEAVGYAPSVSETVNMTADSGPVEVNLVMRLGAELQGRVVADGAPVAGARIGVDLTARTGRRLGGWQQAQQMYPVQAVTDADGRFLVTHVGEGPAEIVAEAVGYVRAWTRVDVPATADVVVELKPALGITGSVLYADGTPAANVQLYVRPVKPGGEPDRTGQIAPVSATSQADGSFTLEGLEDRHYKVIVQTSYWSEGASIQATESDPVRPGSAPVRLTVQRGEEISGRVVSEDGRPVPMVAVTSRAEGQTRPPSGLAISSHAQSDGDGRFRLRGLMPGTHTLSFQPGSFGRDPASHAPGRREDVPSGTTDLEIVLERNLTIAGTVEDTTGRALVSGTVQASPLGKNRGPSAPGQLSAQVGPGGAFRIPGVPKGRYRLRFHVGGDTGYMLVGGEDVEAGRTDLRLLASRGESISGRVVAAETGAAVPGTYVWARAKGERDAAASARVDGNGRFELRGLQSGTSYDVHADRQGWKGARKPGVPAGTRGLSLLLEKGLSVSGRLLDSAGKPVPNAQMQLSHEGGKGQTWVQTDAKGAFSSGGLEAGTYRVRAWAQSLGPGWKQLGTIVAGSTGVDLRVP
jgi:protocatechuate 3,4-dioxygenase beta subunit